MKYLFSFVIVMVLSGCGLWPHDCKETVKCMPDVYRTGVRLYGYTEAEIDTIIVRWYQAGSNFQNRTDSEFIDSATAVSYHMRRDSAGSPFIAEVDVNGEKYFNPELRLLRSEGKDVELSLPGANRVYRITDMVFKGEQSHEFEYSCSDAVPRCYRALVSYKVDGWIGNNEFWFDMRK